MATADQSVVLNNKQSMGLIELRERLFQIVDKWDDDVVKALWDEDGWFVGFGFNGPPVITSPAIGKFQLTTVEKGTDGLGDLIDLDKPESYVGPHDFENAHGVDYYVGLMSVRIPTVIKTSIGTGLPQYTTEKQLVGRKAEPDSVVDNGTDITFIVDSVTEAGVSNVDRKVVVYLKTPQSSVEAVAIEECDVVWDTTNNTITTSGLLGQTSAITDPSYYEVVLLGPWVSRGTDLSVEPGVLFVGTMEGDSGAPATVFDYGDATTMIPIPDLWNVLRYGPSGDLKIEVKQNVGDVAEPQISVKHLGGERTFIVYETGSIEIRNQSTGLTEMFIDQFGKITESGGLFKSTTETIEFDDVNTSAPVPLSDADQTWLPADMQDKTIIGIAEGLNAGDLFSKVVLSGCELSTSPTDYNVDFGAGTVLYKGFKYDKKASASPEVMPASSVRYARYGISTTSFALVAAYPGEVDDDFVYVAKLISDGSGVAEVIDIRAPAFRMDRRTDILVGDMEGGAYEANIPHFATVGAALKAIDVWVNDGVQKRGGTYKIQVVGNCDEVDAPLQIPANGIEICSSRANRGGAPTGPLVQWSGATALFDLNGMGDLVFDGLEMRWTGGATPGGSGVPVRLCFVNTGGPTERIRIQDCRGVLGDGFFYHSSANSQDEILFENCTGNLLGTCGIVFIDTSGLSGGIKIYGCDFKISGTPYTTNANGIYVQGWADAWIANGLVDGAASHGIVAQGCGLNIHDNSVGADGDGIRILAGCTGIASENRIVTVGGNGVYCAANGMRITDNRIYDANANGIYLLGADEVLVEGNHIVDALLIGINSAGDDNIIAKNHVIDPLGDGIEVSGSRNKVKSNYIRKTTGLAIDITGAGDSCSADGNTIEGTTSGITSAAGASHVSVCKNHLDGGTITVSGNYPVVNSNITKGGNIVLANVSTQKGVVIGNNLRLSAVSAGTITAHGQDDVAHNQL